MCVGVGVTMMRAKASLDALAETRPVITCTLQAQAITGRCLDQLQRGASLFMTCAIQVEEAKKRAQEAAIAAAAQDYEKEASQTAKKAAAIAAAAAQKKVHSPLPMSLSSSLPPLPRLLSPPPPRSSRFAHVEEVPLAVLVWGSRHGCQASSSCLRTLCSQQAGFSICTVQTCSPRR